MTLTTVKNTADFIEQLKSVTALNARAKLKLMVRNGSRPVQNLVERVVEKHNIFVRKAKRPRSPLHCVLVPNAALKGAKRPCRERPSERSERFRARS
jgi:hypothetical protein